MRISSIEDAKSTMIPARIWFAVSGLITRRKLIKLIESLEENDDVQNVFSNADIDEAAFA